MSRFLFALVALLALLASASAAEPKLAPEDAEYLDKLIADFFFDPTGAERVTLGYTGTDSRDGWLVRGKGGTGHRVFFTDRDSEPVSPSMVGIDFVAACKARYAAHPKQQTTDEADERRLRSAGVNDEADLTLAAWLHKLGHDDLAAKALATARADAIVHIHPGTWTVPGPRVLLRHKLAKVVASDLISAYLRRDDEEAFEYGAKLYKLYPDVVRSLESGRGWQAESIFADLGRRKQAGTLGKSVPQLTPSALPAETAPRIAAIIVALEDVDHTLHQFNRNNFETLEDDWRVKALVAIGEPAVPALIDAFEKDNRRTRSLWHPAVREAILLALEAIMRVRIVEDLTGKDLLCYPNGRDNKLKRAAAQLRTHWQTFGKFPFDERMMKILIDPRSGDRVCRYAARNLADSNAASNRHWFPMLFGNRVIAKFSNPTAAEAILAAHARHLKAIANGKEKEPESWWELYRSDYLEALGALGDQRIGPAVAKLSFAEPELLLRLQFASAAFRLGAPESLEAIAKELEAGTLKVRIPASSRGYDSQFTREEDLRELEQVICELVEVENPVADRALWALADPNHPHHRATVALLARNCSEWRERTSLFYHPYWIGVARQSLEDTALTGRTWSFEDGRLFCSEDGQLCFLNPPAALLESDLCRARAVERVCDGFGAKLSRSVIGVPVVHPLRVDCDAGLAGVIAATGRYERRYRRLTWIETERLGLSPWERHCFIPDIRPLNRAATPDDVASGDAVFHLDGWGEPAGVAMPAWITLKDKSRGLAVQAESLPDGLTVYGVIFKHGLRAVPQTEVEKVEPITKKQGDGMRTGLGLPATSIY